MKVKYIVVLLLFLVFVQGFIIANVKSRTVDEINFHLHAGYIYLTTGNWERGINNPPLTGALSALPLLFVKDKESLNKFDRVRSPEYITGNKEPFPKKLLIISRLIPIAFMILLGYVVFLWAKDMYGVKSGLLALFLYSFSPNILAFGSLITADIGGALFVILSMYTFWKYINNPTKKRLVVAGICFGLAQITKLLSVFLIPVFILYAVLVYFSKDFNTDFLLNFKKKKMKKISDLAISLLIIFIIGLFIINSIYLFKGTFMPLSSYPQEEFMSTTFKGLYENGFVNWIPLPLPKNYVMGYDLGQWESKDEVRNFFFKGTVGPSFKSYYFVHLLIKTPIAIFVLIILGFLYFRELSLTELYMIFYIIILIVFLTFFRNTLIGYRHLLAIYPMFYLFSSRILKKGIPKNMIVNIVVVISLIWYIASSLFVFPHHLAYFNEFIGGPKNGYKYTIDSNLDWEQDLDLVKNYIKKSNEEILVDPGCVAFTGKAVIPANSLQFQKWVCYTWLKNNFEPVDYIGYSWLVYDVRGTWIQTDNGLVFQKTA